jgi:aminoglycoside phosphotransferase (APT) family kinase protein
MNTADAENAGTTAVREEHRFDEARLSQWMAMNIEGYRGPLAIEQFKGGQSNPTYRLVTPDRSYVLRRKPPGRLLKGAHAIEREAKVQSALRSAGYPVAHVHALCTDDGVIGTWFYIMNWVEGRIFWDATFPTVTRHDRPAYFDAMNATLAQLHTVDYAAIGLSDYGRSGNYFERQIARWSQKYIGDVDAGRDPNMDRVIEWLSANVPPTSDARIIHGDFRCDNLIFHPTEALIIAVLDWELSTLGDPLADFAYHAMMYRMPPGIVAGLADADVAALNIPSEQTYIDHYCRRVGRTSIPDYYFYLAFNFFRLAAIFHGIKGRWLRGTAVSENARERASSFPVLAKLAWNHAVCATGSGTSR